MDAYERIAPLYDVEHADFRDDIDFYLQALPPCSVLEVGTGSGRVAGALAEAGFLVHGVDPSEAMLRRAEVRLAGNANVSFDQGALPDLGTAREYGAIILSLNTLWHLPTSGQQVASLASLARALKPNGLLFVDLSNPLTMADRGAAGQVRERFRGPIGDSTLVVQSAAWDDEAAQMLRLELTYDCVSDDGSLRRTFASLRLRYIYRPELELMLHGAGLRARHVFGSYDMDEYAVDSRNILAVAEGA